MTLSNPIRFTGRGGEGSRLPALAAVLKVIGGPSPTYGYSIQFNFLSWQSFTQLSVFVDQDGIKYGGGAAPAKLIDLGGPENVYLEPQGSPQAANVPQGFTAQDYDEISFIFDGGVDFHLLFTDSGTGLVVKDIEQKFLETPVMMAVEIVGRSGGARVDFKTGAWRLTVTGQGVINDAAGESPYSGVGGDPPRPVIWAIGTAEASNLEMLLEGQTDKQIVVDYLPTP